MQGSFDIGQKNSGDCEPRENPCIGMVRASLRFEFLVLLALGSGCAAGDPVERLATEACEILPGVVADGVGQALGRGVIVETELALWDQGGPSAGLDVIGAAGLGVIRANSTCTVTGRQTSPEGVLLTLERQEPDLDRQEEWSRETVQDLERVARTLQVRVVDTPAGKRVQLDLARARAALAEAQVLAERGDREAALAGLDALTAWFPDPLLRWQRKIWAAPAAAPPERGPATEELDAQDAEVSSP